MDARSEKETEESVWTTGRMSVLEFHKFKCVMETAMRALTDGDRFEYEDPLIKLTAIPVGSTGHIFYTWKFPPQKYWSTETKTKKECLNCLPNGIQGGAQREVWCLHMDYNALKCPYGVPTPNKMCP